MALASARKSPRLYPAPHPPSGGRGAKAGFGPCDSFAYYHAWVPVLEVRISGPPRPVTLRSKVGKGLRGAGVWGGTPVKKASGGRGAKAGLACALMRLNLAPRSPHQRTAPARDFAQQSWKGLEGRRGLGWNPSKKGIRRSRSESRVGLRIDALEPCP